MERIRTELEIPFEVTLLALPLYKTIAKKALDLRKRGMNIHTIAKHLNVNDKTVDKAIEWLKQNNMV